MIASSMGCVAAFHSLILAYRFRERNTILRSYMNIVYRL